jgi:dolichyl-phosphate beta-glucosyltransferase
VTMNEPELSIVVPAYNEESRLPLTLSVLKSYLDGEKVDWEIIIVDDGSQDKTVQLVEETRSGDERIRVVSHSPNAGRGASVREGVGLANGRFILETDSDGSVDAEAIGRFLNAFRADRALGAIFGSREMKGARIVLPQPFLRVFLGYGFLYMAKVVFCLWRTTDFTLGFKMFRKNAALDIFDHQYDNAYVAEAEIVYVAHKRGWKVLELPVIWTDNKDSRIKPFRDSARSFIGVFKIFTRSFSGKY